MRAIQLQMFNDFQRNVGQNEQISEESKAFPPISSPLICLGDCRSYAFLLQNTLFLL